MGKVGSLTVLESLRRAHVPHPLVHVHSISSNIMDRAGERGHQTPSGSVPDHVLLGEALAKELTTPSPPKCQLISLVRDPIACTVSNFFENPHFAAEEIVVDGKVDPERASAYLRNHFAAPRAFDYVFTWFDREVARVFEIDVFSLPFPKEQGFTVFRSAGADLLLLRVEDLDRVGPVAIANFLDLPQPLSLVSRNVREQTDGGDAYRRVRSNLRLGKALCQKIYAHPFATHFYGESEIDTFIRRWSDSDSAA